jgi:hypothetical protein
MLKKLLAPCCALLALPALAGCNVAQVDNAIATDARASLPVVCALGAGGDAAFAALAAAHSLNKADIATESAANTQLQGLCDNPPSDIASAVVTAIGISQIITGVLAAAKSGA